MDADANVFIFSYVADMGDSRGPALGEFAGDDPGCKICNALFIPHYIADMCDALGPGLDESSGNDTRSKVCDALFIAHGGQAKMSDLRFES